MTVRSDDFRKQVNVLWKQAVEQLEDVKDLVLKSRGRFDIKLRRLRLERDRLLNRLGEQTYRLANQGKLPMPSFVRRTVDRLNEVIEGIVETEGSAPAAGKARAAQDPSSSSGKAGSAGRSASTGKASEKQSSKTVAKKTKASKKTAAKKTAAKKTKAATSRRKTEPEAAEG